MLFAPKALSTVTFSREELKTDLQAAHRFGHCALGKRAVYVGAFGLLRCVYYIPLVRVRRVFKRLAVTKGFYEGKIYGTLAYLVLQYDDGREKTCRFEHEEDVDDMLHAFRKFTSVPVGKQ